MNRQKRHLTGWKATIAVSMSNYIDSGSIIAIATSLGFWSAAYFPDDDGSIAGLLAAFSANAFGAAVGALLGGTLSDRYGRKFIYRYDLLLYSLGGIITIFAVNVPMLFIGFLIVGIAVGVTVPAGWTYIAESAPPDRRGRHVATTQLAWSVGPFIGFGLAAALSPLGLLGSRIIFAHLVVIALFTWWLRLGLDESKEWTAANANRAAGVKRPSIWKSIGGLFTLRVNVTGVLFLAAIYTFWNLAASQNGIFLPTILQSMGFGTIESDLFSMLSWGVIILSTFAFMFLVDRISYRWHFALGGSLAILAWVVLVFGDPNSAWTAFGYAILWGLACGPSAQAFYSVWSAELFATPYRAGAQGLVFFLVRLASGIISLIFPIILATENGLLTNGLLLIGFLLASLLIGVIWTPKTQGKTLQQIELERYGRVISGNPQASPAGPEASASGAAGTAKA